MNTIITKFIYESDDSDGYPEGTWGYTVRIEPPNAPWFASGCGGFASREHAAEEMEKYIGRVRDSL